MKTLDSYGFIIQTLVLDFVIQRMHYDDTPTYNNIIVHKIYILQWLTKQSPYKLK